VTDHFAKLNDVISSSDIPPDCIWNCDETGFQFQNKPKPNLVCTRKGAKVVPGRTAQSWESVSVLVCGNAKGKNIQIIEFMGC